MAHRPSIRALVAAIVVVPIVIVSGALVALSGVTHRRIAESLAEEIVRGATDRVSAEVRSYLSQAVRVSDVYARRLASGVLPASGHSAAGSAWERAMFDDLLANPNVASICFGSAQDEATWLLRNGGNLELGRVSGPGENAALEFVVDADGVAAAEPKRAYQFIATKRPWYTAATETLTPTWTDVYFWFGEASGAAQTGTGYTRAVRTRTGDVIGALVIDVTLGALSEFVAGLPIAERGAVFIIDDEGYLVAASQGRVVSADAQRMRLSESDSPTAQGLAEVLGAPASSTGELLRLAIAGEPVRAEIVRLTPFSGIKWTVIAALPESAFLGDAHAAMRRSIVMAALAAIGAVVLGLRLSRSISSPLETIAAHVKAVGAGDFERRLDLKAARELEQLSGELNTMAGGLKHRMELRQAMSVAMEVQQSLLPRGDPTLDHLDVVGRTRYCDETGGDYFDFIDISAVSPGKTLLALGDVMGHGIAAALLMASARAALRSHAPEEGSLAVTLTKVNRLLASETHGRFMTLLLLLLDPIDGTARWASAGHDAPIVYTPATDSFQELEGGDLPLGVMEGVEYQEFHRAGLKPGDVIMLGTDGIWEMRSPAGEHFGKERLRAIIRAHHASSAATIADTLQAELARFGAGAAQDDVTFVVARVL